MICTNCGAPKHDERDFDVCLLAALCGVVEEREDYPRERIQRLMAQVDTDELWERLGPVVDWLEDQLKADPNGECPDCGEQLRDGVCINCPDPDDGPTDAQLARYYSEPASPMTILDKDYL